MKNPLEMCFPSKKTKENFADPNKPAASTSAPAATEPEASGTAAHGTVTEAPEAPKVEPAAAPQITTEIPKGGIATDSATSTGPKIAIVIYTMYGHIGKRKYLLHHGVKKLRMAYPNKSMQSRSRSRRASRRRVESLSSTRFRRPSLTISSPLCTHLPSRVIPSSPLTSSQSTMGTFV